MSDRFDSRFAQKLEKALMEELAEAHRDLGNGNQVIRDDAAATGMNYARYVGQIHGLNIAAQRMQEIHDEMMGKGPKEKRD